MRYALFALMSCLALGEVQAGSVDYFPLHPGDLWIYVATTHQRSGTTTDTVSVSVDSSLVIDGKTYYRFGNVGPYLEGPYRKDETNNVWIYRSGQEQLFYDLSFVLPPEGDQAAIDAFSLQKQQYVSEQVTKTDWWVYPALPPKIEGFSDLRAFDLSYCATECNDTVVLAGDLGIVRRQYYNVIGDSYGEEVLIYARVNGREYGTRPTGVNPATWGEIKRL
jgi:hypothetical protein